MDDNIHNQEITASPPRRPGRPRPGLTRLLVEMPIALHRRARIGSTTEGRALSDVIRTMLAERYPEPAPAPEPE